MPQPKSVEHKGRIVSIIGDKISVNFIALSACAACHAKGVCTASDMEEKTAEVIDSSGQYKVGDNVNVILAQSLGYKALFLGYVLPFILVLVVLIILSAITKNEVVAGAFALGILAPYYLGLMYFKDKIRKTFTFTIRKID